MGDLRMKDLICRKGVMLMKELTEFELTDLWKEVRGIFGEIFP